MSSGEYPSSMSMGTKMGDVIAHCADADDMLRLMSAEMMMKIISRIPLSRFSSCKNTAPLTAVNVPIWL